MPKLSDMSLVNFQDGKGPRHIDGLVWSPVSRLWEATIIDPQGNRVFIGSFEDPGRAVEAMRSMEDTFARSKVCYGTKVGGPKPK